jgi:hypothetical protein
MVELDQLGAQVQQVRNKAGNVSRNIMPVSIFQGVLASLEQMEEMD